jgi:hypothetical protein
MKRSRDFADMRAVGARGRRTRAIELDKSQGIDYEPCEVSLSETNRSAPASPGLTVRYNGLA